MKALKMKVKALMVVLAPLYLWFCYTSQEDNQSGNQPLGKGRDGLDKQTTVKVEQRSSDKLQEALAFQNAKEKTNKDVATTKSMINGLNIKKTKTYISVVVRKRSFQDQVITSHFQELKCKNDSKDVQVTPHSARLIGFFKELRQRKRRNTDPLPDIKNCTSSLVSCKGRCINERDVGGTQKPRCSCDPYCDYFKDCCADYVQYCLEGQQRSNMKVPDEQWTCRSGIWMIASCPHSWTNQNINRSCISIRSITADNYKEALPVVAADNKTYANRFCAQCHGQSIRTIFNLVEKIEFQCLVTPPGQTTKQKKMRFLFKHCRNSFDLKKDVFKRNCFKSVSKCNKTLISSEETRNKCLKNHYGLVYEPRTKKLFKNVYCALCNNAGLVSCGPFPRREKINKHRPTSTAAPFSVIMDIGGETSPLPKLSENLSCPRGKVYDIYLETCRQGQQLVPLVSRLEIYSIATWIKMTNHSIIPVIFPKVDFSRSLASALGFNFTRILNFDVEVIDSDDNDQNDLIKIEFQVDLTGYIQTTSRSTVISFSFGLSTPFQLQIGNATFIVIKVTTKPLTCFETNTYSPSDYQVLPGTDASVYINKTGEVLGKRDYFSTNLTIIEGKQVPVGQIVVCRQMPSVNCSGMYIFLQEHEYTIFPNRSVLRKDSGRLYEHSAYAWRNGTIMICTNFTVTYKQRSQSVTSNDHKALTILTYIGFCISVACLLFVLVTYSIFADLRTIPGINLMNLCSALLVAQLLWLIGSGMTFTQLGCMVIAIILHYSFLTSFWWMSIIAFNTWKAFSGKTSTCNYRNEKGQKRKRIIRTMAMGWLPLVMYVSICVALDRSGTVAIGYGGEKGCWINNPRANLFFFAVPVGLSILWNAVFFVLIIKEIKKAMDQSQMAASQHQARQDSTVYARIAVLMGFTWVFGFVAPFTSYYLMYPFVLFNAVQGLYIAVAFGFTRRVRTLYRNIRNIWNRRASSKRHKRSIEGTHKTKV